MRNATTVFTGCGDQQVDGPFRAPAQVFDPASGKSIALPTPPTVPGAQLVSHACTVTTLGDGRQRVIYLVSTKTPPQGLTPETENTELVAMDPTSTTPLAVKPFPFQDTTNWYLYPATNGFSVAHTLGGTTIHETITDVAFFDATTLDVTAKAHGDGDLTLAGINYDGYTTISGTDAHFYSGADGSPLGDFPNATGVHYSLDHGMLLQHGPSTPDVDTSVQYFDFRSRTVTAAGAPGLPGNGGFAPGAADVEDYADTVLLSDQQFQKFVVVFDTAAKKVVFALDAQHLAGLGITGARLGGHFLYLTNGSDDPVIDYLTSQKVSTGWQLMAVAKLAGGWVYLHRSTPVTVASEGCVVGTAFGTTCANAQVGNDHLARSAAGDYDGPWF